MEEYGFNFATLEPLDAEALHFLHDSLKRMWRAQEDKKEVSEGELSTSSMETSGHDAIIPSTYHYYNRWDLEEEGKCRGHQHQLKILPIP